jgi:hypothetical protein
MRQKKNQGIMAERQLSSVETQYNNLLKEKEIIDRKLAKCLDK